MTDRTSELKHDYEAMQGILDRFEHRQTLKVEPHPLNRWFLFEKEGEVSWISQYGPEMYVYMKKYWGVKGWTVTIIDIFRAG